jgi:uncharacterized membrane protein YhaH (DUF805 family)
MFCKNCGKEISDDSRFCEYCGANFAAGGAPPTGAPYVPPQQPAYYPPPQGYAPQQPYYPPQGYAPPQAGYYPPSYQPPKREGLFFKGIRHYADFHGRARRTEYWLFGLFYAVFGGLWMLLGFGILYAAGLREEQLQTGLIVTALIFQVFMILPQLAVTVRRLHDNGCSGWMILIGLIPYLGVILLFVLLCFFPGHRFPNKYGPDPKADI